MKKHSSKFARIVLTALAIVCFSISAVSFITGYAKKANADTIEYGVLSTTHMKIEKNEFNVGEPIYVTATVDTAGAGDWVGIVRKDVTSPSIRYRYVDKTTTNTANTGFGDGAKIDVKLGKIVEDYDDYATYQNIPAGEYYVVFGKADCPATEVTEMIPITVKSTAKSDSYLSVSKTDFYEGEDIVFSHNVTSPATKDWVGITASDYTKGSIKWDYVTTAKGASIVANDITQRALPQYKYLPAGEYNLIYVLNNGSAYQAKSVIPITIHAKLDGTKTTTHMSMQKTTFYEGEPILVTPKNTGSTDWVGIATSYTISSIRYFISTNTQQDIRKGTVTSTYSGKALANIPAGVYQIIYVANDQTAHYATEWLNIQVLPAPNPSAPSNVTLNLDNQTDGYFEGSVTVNFANYSDTASYVRATDVIMYWADENGNKLAEYSSLAKRKISSATTTFKLHDGVIIPTNAKKLLVYAINSAGKVSDPYAVTLPTGSQYKNDKRLIMEYNVVSDLHITIDPTNDKTTHYGVMLEDIAKLSPNSQGVMVVGDAVDTGSITEYEYLVSKYNDLKKTYGDDLPTLYFAIGNHELMCGIPDEHGYNVNNTSVPGDDTTQIARWREYVLQVNSNQFDTSVPYYVRWTGGIQHIYLCTEALSSRANGAGYLSTTQLNWLDNQIASNTTGNPIMIYLHQPIYNTVAGTLEPENWDEVLAGVTTSYGEDATSRLKNEKALRDIFAKYYSTKDLFMFNGHSHWYFDADRTMYSATNLPTIFNTSSVGYLWNDYNVVEGVYERGSQGYYVRVYEDRMEVFGRNFDEANWASSAQFVVYTHTHDYQPSYDESNHYDACSCGDKKNVESHTIVNGNCACGYHKHTYVAGYDETHHYEECVCGDIINQVEHSFDSDGNCECNYHKHNYVAKYNETHHYEECSCGDIINPAPHNLTDGDCDCGYIDPNYQPPTGDGDEDEGGDITPPPSGGDNSGDGGSSEGVPPTGGDDGGEDGSTQQPSTDNNNNSSNAMSCSLTVSTFEGTIYFVSLLSLMLIAFVVIKVTRKTKNN